MYIYIIHRIVTVYMNVCSVGIHICPLPRSPMFVAILISIFSMLRGLEGAPVQKEAGASSPTRRPFEAKLTERSDGIRGFSR